MVEKILAVEDVMNILRMDADTVVSLLQSGELAGFRIDTQWRIRESDLELFLDRKVESQRQKSFADAISNPKTWAKTLSEFPDLQKQIENTDYSEGTFGAFLKNAWRQANDKI